MTVTAVAERNDQQLVAKWATDQRAVGVDQGRDEVVNVVASC